MKTNGRLIAVEITSQGKRILTVNIYAPNGAKNFFQDLQKYLAVTNYEHTIVMGYFNGTVDNNFDRSVTQNQSKEW